MTKKSTKPAPLTLAEQKARDSQLRRMRAFFNGTLTPKNRPVFRGFTFDGLAKKKD